MNKAFLVLALAVVTNANALPISPAEIHRRTELVFATFRVPAEPSAQPLLDAIETRGTVMRFRSALALLDPFRQFGRFFAFSAVGGGVLGFADRDAKGIAQFTLSLSTIEPADPRFTLNGLRVALDPGHMGGALWDERTGKRVVGPGGVIVSEGVIALQTAILLRAELERLGATVFLTRETLAPVTDLPYEETDVDYYARREIRVQSLFPWFQAIVATATSDADLLKRFRASADFNGLFKPLHRITYFSLHPELEARAEKIRAFRPDLTLVIHYDATDGGIVNRVNRAKAYVPGGFLDTDFATAEERADILLLAGQPQYLDSSRRLGQSILDALHTQLGIAYEPESLGGKGIIARNLTLNRMLPGSTLTYLESSYYDTTETFAAFARKDYPMTIGGESRPYSKRVLDIARAMRDGIVRFVSEGPAPVNEFDDASLARDPPIHHAPASELDRLE